MSDYEDFAGVYDPLMVNDAPHADWLTWLSRQSAVGRLPDLAGLTMADIGCGTGRLTVALAHTARAVIGVDRSEAMLAQAAQRAFDERANVRWICQDIRQLHLPTQVDLILSTCDSLNYLLTSEDWRSALTGVVNNLSTAGWFCFDVLGPARLTSLQDGVWHDVNEDHVALFETRVTATDRIAFEVHAFTRLPGTEQYRRIEERHEQQYVANAQLEGWLAQAGLRVVDCIGDFGRTDLALADRTVWFTQKADR